MSTSHQTLSMRPEFSKFRKKLETLQSWLYGSLVKLDFAEVQMSSTKRWGSLEPEIASMGDRWAPGPTRSGSQGYKSSIFHQYQSVISVTSFISYWFANKPFESIWFEEFLDAVRGRPKTVRMRLLFANMRQLAPRTRTTLYDGTLSPVFMPMQVWEVRSYTLIQSNCIRSCRYVLIIGVCGLAAGIRRIHLMNLIESAYATSFRKE